MTGFSDAVADLSGKFVDLAIELGGQRAPIDYLWHTAWVDGQYRFELTEKAAQAAGVTLRSRPLTDIADLEPQLAAMKSDGATILIIQPGPFAHRYRKQIFKSATSAGYATIYGIAPAAHDGALIAYGPDLMECITGPVNIALASSKAKSQPTFQFSNPRIFNWPSTWPPQRRSA